MNTETKLAIPPEVLDHSKIGDYDLLCKAGGGMIWDDVLEYRVWSRENDTTECFFFDCYEDAAEFSDEHNAREIPLALVLQKECFWGNNAEDAKLESEERITEWQVPWLRESNHRPSMLKRALRSQS